MRFRIILADSGLEAVFAVRRKAINQAAMMRDKAQRQHLTDQTAFLAVSAQIEPKKLRTGSGVVNYLLAFLFVKVFLEFFRVFAEIVEQAQQSARFFRADFLGGVGAESGGLLQMLDKGLFRLVTISAASDGGAMHGSIHAPAWGGRPTAGAQLLWQHLFRSTPPLLGAI